MSDGRPASVRTLLAAMGLAAASATPGCIFAVGNPAPPPIDAGPDDPPDAGHDAGLEQDAAAANEDAGADDAGPGDAGPDEDDGGAPADDAG